MRKFLIKISFFAVIISLIITSVFLTIDGKNDLYYLRISSPKQSSLIIGTSRAAQGIVPSIINASLQGKNLYNYSFSNLHSPFGRVYFNSIKDKLDTTNKNKENKFIIAVDPWSLSIDTIKEKNKFREENTFLNGLNSVNTHPNFNYLINYYENKYVDLLGSSNSYELHKDGWLEINIAMDSLKVIKRTEDKVKGYIDNKLYSYTYSKNRETYFIESIDYLNKFGKVFIVRLPIDSTLMKVEDSFMPSFSSKIDSIAKSKKVRFLDLTYLNDSMNYTDGSHLHKNSSKKVSQLIARYIKNSID